jgi:hypothetical protein
MSSAEHVLVKDLAAAGLIRHRYVADDACDFHRGARAKDRDFGFTRWAP